jgi:ElaB/YqjD/DUF883 family membrane-anchored ribosome-binding protein
MSTPEASTLKEKFKKLVPWIEEDIMYNLADVAQEEISKLKTANDFLNQENQTLKELAAKIEAANEKLAEITQNREYQCFAESALIPCKANCARGYEKLCDQITELTVILANQIPRKEDSGTLEEHLANLRKQSPAKCQDCECLHVENHGPDHAGYVYVCETSPKC